MLPKFFYARASWRTAMMVTFFPVTGFALFSLITGGNLNLAKFFAILCVITIIAAIDSCKRDVS